MKNKKILIIIITNLFIISLVGMSAYGNIIEDGKENISEFSGEFYF